MLKAVIIDLEGVIIDNKPLNSKNRYHTQLHANEHPSIPYVIDLIEDLHKNGIKLMVISTFPANLIDTVLISHKIKDYFMECRSVQPTVESDYVPDMYLRFTGLIDVLPEECVVISASQTRINSAHLAGITTIGFQNSVSEKQNLRKADILVEGFDEVDTMFIHKIYQYSHNLPVTILTTENFIIRELTVEDITDLYQIYEAGHMRNFLYDMSDSLAVEKEKHRAYIHNIYHLYGFGLWGVFLKHENRLIGRCGIEYKTSHGEEIYELGYLLDPLYQGHGYATEYVTAIIKYCFEELGIERIVAVIDKTNVKSLKLASRIGMHKYGECYQEHQLCYKYEIMRTTR